MTTEKILEELTDAAERCGLDVRTEKGDFGGGRCRMAGEEVVMLNKRDLPERRLAVLARAFRPAEVKAVYLPPAVRKALEEARAEEQREAGKGPPADASDDPPGEEAPAHAG